MSRGWVWQYNWVLRAPKKLAGMAKYRYQLRKGRIGCQVPVAWFIYGPQTCGFVATHIVKTLDTGEDMPVCENHFADYKRLEREAAQ